ncbi:Hypothetical predicted protein [Lecanosticta acicola]|uniref:Carrier domain-containing protein n=1 Tax=Lecanosticta acicola TaxID=111012 RepID=A0AAI8Z2K6_9PEZI|nr:Hypothetical predicted protein [Lecanosticta acicola]
MGLQVGMNLQKFLDILFEEAWIPLNDLENDAEIADLGIDRILARAFSDQIARATCLSLPVDQFQSVDTVQNFIDRLKKVGAAHKGDKGVKAVEVSPNSNAHKPQTGKRAFSTESNEKLASKQVRLILRLKGNPVTTSKKVFLMPDGSGSAMA